jgi:hypothetical protein
MNLLSKSRANLWVLKTCTIFSISPNLTLLASLDVAVKACRIIALMKEKIMKYTLSFETLHRLKTRYTSQGETARNGKQSFRNATQRRRPNRIRRETF